MVTATTAPRTASLVVFVPLAGFIVEGVFVRAVEVEVVVSMIAIEPVLPAPEFGGARAARAQVVDALLDLSDPPFEGTQKRVARACKPALEDAHREPHGGAVVERAAVGVKEVGGGGVVQRLFAIGVGGKVVAERAALAIRIERSAIEANHLLLGPTDEVAFAGGPGKTAERLAGREDLWVEQPPEKVVGSVSTHVGRRREQEHVTSFPSEPSKRLFGAAQPARASASS